MAQIELSPSLIVAAVDFARLFQSLIVIVNLFRLFSGLRFGRDHPNEQEEQELPEIEITRLLNFKNFHVVRFCGVFFILFSYVHVNAFGLNFFFFLMTRHAVYFWVFHSSMHSIFIESSSSSCCRTNRQSGQKRRQ